MYLAMIRMAWWVVIYDKEVEDRGENHGEIGEWMEIDEEEYDYDVEG